MATIAQSVQPLLRSQLQITAVHTPAKTLKVTVEKFDGTFYDPSDQTFKAYGSISNPYLGLTESPGGSGNYSTQLDVTLWVDGNYKTDLYDATVDPANPVKLLDDQTIYVDGGSQSPTGTLKTRVDHHYQTTDSLRYVDGNGSPIENAEVYAFSDAAYSASAATLQAIAKTKTLSDGRWESPFFLLPGTYVILFRKENLYGPDTQTIVVV